MFGKLNLCLFALVIVFFPVLADAKFGEGKFEFSYFGKPASIDCSNAEGSWHVTYFEDGRIERLYTQDEDIHWSKPCEKKGLAFKKAKGAWYIDVKYPGGIKFDAQGNVERLSTPLPFVNKFKYAIEYGSKRAYDTNMMSGFFTFWPSGSLKSIVTLSGVWLNDSQNSNDSVRFTRIEFSEAGDVTKIIPCESDVGNPEEEDILYCKNWDK